MTQRTPADLSSAMRAYYEAALACSSEVATFMLENGCSSEDHGQTMSAIAQQEGETPWSPEQGFITY